MSDLISITVPVNGVATTFNNQPWNAITNPFGLPNTGWRQNNNLFNLLLGLLAAASPGLQDTSATSLTIGTGSKTVTLDSNRPIPAGVYCYLIDSADTANLMGGKVTDHTDDSLTIDVIYTEGSGTIAAWTVQPSGVPGPAGADYTLNANLDAISAAAANGFYSRDGAAVNMRSITGTAGEITITNGDGTAGAPTASLPDPLALAAKTVTGGKFKSPTGIINALGTGLTGTVNIDLSLGSIITGTISGNTTFIFGNSSSYAASGVYQSWETIITLDATPHTVTFQHSSGNAVTWDSVSGAPTLVASKELHVVFETIDGGATIKATAVGQF